MKLKNRHFSNILPLLFTASLITLTTAHAAKSPKKERWFEIEVILFSQLGDKNNLKEAFPAQSKTVNLSKLPRYRRTIDLLTPYLYPNISTIKQQLPLCASAMTTHAVTTLAPLTFIEQREQNATVFSPYQSKSLEELNNEMLVEKVSADDIYNTESDTIDDTNFTLEMGLNDGIEQNLVSDGTFSDESLPDFKQNDQVFVSQLTDDELILIAQAEQTFPPLSFDYHNLLTDKQLCRLPASFFTTQMSANPHFNIDDYSVNKLTKTLDGIEDLYGNNPYLIAKDSLQLNDIVKQLKRSKDFRPLLHLGWREAPKGRNKAIAQRIYAGDNLATNFKQQQSAYQYALEIEQTEALKHQQLSSETITENNAPLDNTPLDGEIKSKEQRHEEQMQQIVQQRINQIISQAISDQLIIKQTNDGPNKTINEHDFDELLGPVIPLELTLLSNNPDDNQKTMLPIKPTKPIQDWYLDGFFKVHLNHYLYITADFNIVNQTLAQSQTQALMPKNISKSTHDKNELKSIRFEQNRRVISGEIHYFDHPYIGMIVQIRRFKQPEPELEEEILAIKQD